jgi:BirA family biotin operon repressor/biotin-[acetyl-CoA-carboxylase] ligase
MRATDSTNERARELALAGAPGGTVVTAEEQTSGRGRRGRVWSAPPRKALLYSAVLRDLDERHALLPVAVPLAVCDAVEALAPVSCRVKWPNDVWIEERKVAGVLIEARPPQWAVIGIGINVAIEQSEFPADLRWPAASVGHGATVADLREALNAALSESVAQPADDVLAAFRERDALFGREVGWVGSGEGRGVARGIDERGNILVETEGGERVALGSGEVSLRIGKPMA